MSFFYNHNHTFAYSFAENLNKIKMKKIVAKLKLKENFVERFEDLAAEMLIKTRKEKGCIEYCMLKDVEDPCSFLFYEEYENQEAIDHHFSTQYFKEFMDEVKPNFEKEPIIDIY